MTNDIKKLDPKREETDVTANLAWHDALNLTIEGQGWENLESPFDRLPIYAKEKFSALHWRFSKNSAGIAIRFITNSPSMGVTWATVKDEQMRNMTSNGANGLDLYVKYKNEWRWLAVGKADGGKIHKRELFSNLEPVLREYLLYLPLYNACESLKIGITKDASIQPAPKRKKAPILFYGTSIVQGACASRAGMCHASIIGRKLNLPIINLGFAGNGKMEIEMAELLCETNPAIFVIDCLPNLEEPTVTERTEPFILLLRKKKNDTPILLIDNILYAQSYLDKTTMARYLTSNCAQYMAFEKLQASGVKNLHYLKDDGLLGDDYEGTVDGTHPNDLGFMRMAEMIGKKIKSILQS